MAIIQPNCRASEKSARTSEDLVRKRRVRSSTCFKAPQSTFARFSRRGDLFRCLGRAGLVSFCSRHGHAWDLPAHSARNAAHRVGPAVSLFVGSSARLSSQSTPWKAIARGERGCSRRVCRGVAASLFQRILARQAPRLGFLASANIISTTIVRSAVSGRGPLLDPWAGTRIDMARAPLRRTLPAIAA